MAATPVTVNSLPVRTTIESGDAFFSKRGSAAGAEGMTPFAVLLAALLAEIGSGFSVVTFPADSAAAGAIGQIAINTATGVLGIYVGLAADEGPNWVFLNYHEI
jgi:hypothetical protein